VSGERDSRQEKEKEKERERQRDSNMSEREREREQEKNWERDRARERYCFMSVSDLAVPFTLYINLFALPPSPPFFLPINHSTLYPIPYTLYPNT